MARAADITFDDYIDGRTVGGVTYPPILSFVSQMPPYRVEQRVGGRGVGDYGHTHGVLGLGVGSWAGVVEFQQLYRKDANAPGIGYVNAAIAEIASSAVTFKVPLAKQYGSGLITFHKRSGRYGDPAHGCQRGAFISHRRRRSLRGGARRRRESGGREAATGCALHHRQSALHGESDGWHSDGHYGRGQVRTGFPERHRTGNRARRSLRSGETASRGDDPPDRDGSDSVRVADIMGASRGRMMTFEAAMEKILKVLRAVPEFGGRVYMTLAPRSQPVFPTLVYDVTGVQFADMSQLRGEFLSSISLDMQVQARDAATVYKGVDALQVALREASMVLSRDSIITVSEEYTPAAPELPAGAIRAIVGYTLSVE